MPGPEDRDQWRRRVTVEYNDGQRQTIDADSASAARDALIGLQRRQGERTFVVVGEELEEPPPPDAGTDAGPDQVIDAARRVQRVYGATSAYEDQQRPQPRQGGVQAGMSFEAPLSATVEDPVTGEQVTFESYQQGELDRQVSDFMRGRERAQRSLVLTGSQRLPGKASSVPMSRYPSDEMMDEAFIRPGYKR